MQKRAIWSLKFLVLSLGFFVHGANEGFGQNINTIYFMNQIPQSSLLNPANQTASNFYIGLPGISSISLDFKNNFTSYGEVIYRSPVTDSLISFLHPDGNINSFLTGLQHQNTISSDLDAGLFSLGFRSRKSYFTFHIRERVSFTGSMPREMLVFVLKGNEDFIGKTADFSSFGVNFSAFREFAAGFSHQITPAISIGARGKLLYGKGNLSYSNSELTILTDPEDFSMHVRSVYTLNSSLPIKLEYNENDEISDVISRFDYDYDILSWAISNFNPGFAVDVGATYSPVRALTLSASIIDLGFINWEKDVYNFSVNGNYKFEGVDITPAINGDSNNDVFENLLDSITDIFAISETRNPYRTRLNSKILIGGTYSVHQRLHFGALSRFDFNKNLYNAALTLSANSNLTNWLSASLSYTLTSNSFTNFGAGFSMNLGPFQFYMISDHLNAVFYPGVAQAANVWLGMNLVFGYKNKNKIQEFSTDE